MSTQQLADLTVSYKSSTDLSATAHENKLVVLSATEGMIELANASSDLPIGVLQNLPKDQAAAAVSTLSGAVMEIQSDGSGTAISVGDRVGPNTAGRVVSVNTDNWPFVGLAEQASQTAGLIIKVRFTGPQRV